MIIDAARSPRLLPHLRSRAASQPGPKPPSQDNPMTYARMRLPPPPRTCQPVQDLPIPANVKADCSDAWAPGRWSFCRLTHVVKQETMLPSGAPKARYHTRPAHRADMVRRKTQIRASGAPKARKHTSPAHRAPSPAGTADNSPPLQWWEPPHPSNHKSRRDGRPWRHRSSKS